MKQFGFVILLILISAISHGDAFGEKKDLPSLLSGRLAPKGNTETTAGKIDFKNEPTFIKSDSLSLQSEQRIFTYTGNVEVKHGDITMTCKILEGTYDEKNRIEEIVAKEEVLVTRGTTKARGGRAVYTTDSETIVLTENPELEDEGSVLTADRVIIYLAEDRSSAEGQVRVKLISRPE
jgi:lipopolysaccharide transport protein LptA